MNLGSAVTPSTGPRIVHVADPRRFQVVADMNISVNPASGADLPTTTLACAPATSCSFAGFKVGMQVTVSGVAGPLTIKSIGTGSLTLYNVALTPTLTGLNAPGGAPVKLTVTGYDPLLDGGVRIGGDTIKVGPAPAGGVLAGPNSPLVVYGDTSQDGVWYSGHSYDVLGYEFGPKPFDPFVRIPDAENEDDEWIFPLANPYVYAGNDVIDGSALFANVTCTSASCVLPSVGFSAYGGEGNDLIIGSQAGDHLAGGSGDDEIRGLRGVDHIYGDSGINVNILTRALSIETTSSTPGPTITKAGFQNNGTTIEPTPSPVADNMDAGRDLIFGEGPGTIYGGPQAAYDDIIFGDHGAVIQQVTDPNLPDTRLQKIQTTLLSSVRRVESRAYQNGNDDIVFANLGRDLIVGGAWNDMLDGYEHDDIIFGDQVFLLRRIAETGQTDIVAKGDTTSGRFQTLCGGLLYSRTDRVDSLGRDECGVIVGTDTSGRLLVDGTWRDFRDPDSPGIVDLFPWWAEYAVNFSDGDASHHFHDLDADLGYHGKGSFGNDYITGGPQHDLGFGQLGNDTLLGDGGILDAFARMIDDAKIVVHVSASRTPDGCSSSPIVCDFVGDLDLVASQPAATDGEDYREGNGGNDLLLGGLGQDDLIGGSSAFFSLVSALLRPDGNDLIFGGAGTVAGRNDDTTSVAGAAALDVHARDADTILGDNGNIVRIVGTNGTALAPATDTGQRYVRFSYDNYDNTSGAAYDANKKIVVRGVHLLDYTPGGPDFNLDAFGLATNPTVCSGAAASGNCSPPIAKCYTGAGLAANGSDRLGDVGGRDEIHGESGDDTAYGGCGNDTLYGDAQDDDLIGGWGDDWMSGGTGVDGLLGDDGRIFTSRNTGCTGTNCWQDNVDYSESLYGVEKFLNGDPDLKVIHGYVLNETISTPGQVQIALINASGLLKKEFDITPYNLGPNVVAGHSQVDLPLYDANNSDDVLFGGWDDDFLHGASGDDAIAGGEALTESYVQHFAASGEADGVVRNDWTRPWNPGNLLLFGADVDPWNAPKPIRSRLGEFYLYDEYDPRRAILFNADGSKWSCSAFSNSGHTCTSSTAPPPRQYFLNLSATEGRNVIGCGAYATNGTCTNPTAIAQSDGNDVLFGDLGNDWMIGGTGKDDHYGGWGNDIMNADDVQTTNGSLNDTTDTHSSYEDRAYGGAGIDILIGNTGGDRLIDWVGEWNSYLVPFSPFGIATVSRQVSPFLPEFLYALSASDGADPTRDTDTGSNITRPGRNGEYEGELGLILQQDHGYWQQQTGAPTDPQPGNIPGGARDVLRGADFNSGTTSGFAVDSGAFEVTSGVLRVAAGSLGGDAAAVFYHDEYLPIYYELSAQVAIDKATAGWDGNSFVIFDYFSPTDFKYAGINQKTNKLELGHRTAAGWIVDAQSPLKVWDNKFYAMLVAVNGTAVTVNIDGTKAFTYVFDARMLNGEAVGLNKGMVGVGSSNSRGYYDNVKIQVLPPKITLDETEDFNDGVAQRLSGESAGTWTVSGGRETGIAPTGGIAYDLVELGIGRGLQAGAYLEINTTLRTSGSGGIIFDRYSATDYKYVTIDTQTGAVVLGHSSRRSGFVTDLSVARTLLPNTDYALGLTFKGTTISITVGGSFIASFSFNGILVDGGFGLLSQRGTTSFDLMRIRTNDSAFPDAGPTQAGATPAPLITSSSGSPQISGASTNGTISSSSSSTISSSSTSSTTSSGLPGP
jgi:Ca2+-binding RTX toxin-like protein